MSEVTNSIVSPTALLIKNFHTSFTYINRCKEEWEIWVGAHNKIDREYLEVLKNLSFKFSYLGEDGSIVYSKEYYETMITYTEAYLVYIIQSIILSEQYMKSMYDSCEYETLYINQYKSVSKDVEKYEMIRVKFQKICSDYKVKF